MKGFDNYIYWHYVISIEGYYIHFLDNLKGLEVLIQGSDSFSEEDWKILIKKLKDDYKRYGPDKSKVLNSLEERNIFINPHTRLSSTICELIQRLESLDLSKPSIDKPSINELQNWIRNITEAMRLGTCLKAIIPVWGESCVNLIFYLLRKRKVVGDKRICDFFVQQPIDVKIKTLHLYCNGFKDGVDFSKKQFSNFISLMQYRNDYLHGNIKPEQLKVEKIMYDGKIPIFQDERGFLIRTVENSLHQIKKEDVLKDIDTTKEFISFILSYLEENYHKKISRSLERFYLNFEGGEAFPIDLEILIELMNL